MGDDELIGSAGHNVLDGGLGSDTLVLAGHSAAYTCQSRPDASWLISYRGVLVDQGVEVFRNIEFLRFSDKTIPVG